MTILHWCEHRQRTTA